MNRCNRPFLLGKPVEALENVSQIFDLLLILLSIYADFPVLANAKVGIL